MPQKKASRRRPPRAFTLIELLVVITIISILMAILLPSLSIARRKAQATVGAANLRSLSQVMFVYTNDHSGAFLNPFRAQWPDGTPGSPAWTDLVSDREAGMLWDFSSVVPEFQTEFFAYSWYSWLAEYDGGSRCREEQFSPADPELKSMKVDLASNQETRESWMLWPSSFLYSPTFWLSPARYHEGFRDPVTPNLLRTATTASISTPSAKVMLWERADFDQAQRLEIKNGQGQRAGHAPAWNNLRASPWVALADGSCTEVSIGDLIVAAAKDPALNPGGSMAAVDGPSLIPPKDQQSFPIGGDMNADGDYPLFFWATNQGVAGRDINR